MSSIVSDEESTAAAAAATIHHTENVQTTTTTNDDVSQQLAETHLSPPPSMFIPVPSSLPTTLSRSYRLTVNDNDDDDATTTTTSTTMVVDAYVQLFQDCLVVGVSMHAQKIGTWCRAQATPSAVDPRAIEWDFSTVLGDRSDALLHVYARQILQGILQKKFPLRQHGNDGLTLLLGMTLQERGKNPQFFRVLVNLILGLIQDVIHQQQQR